MHLTHCSPILRKRLWYLKRWLASWFVIIIMGKLQIITQFYGLLLRWWICGMKQLKKTWSNNWNQIRSHLWKISLYQYDLRKFSSYIKVQLKLFHMTINFFETSITGCPSCEKSPPLLLWCVCCSRFFCQTKFKGVD